MLNDIKFELEVCGNGFFIPVPSHSRIPVTIPVPILVAAHIYFHSHRLSKWNSRYLPWKFPHLITRNLNGGANQIWYVQTAHYTAPSEHTVYDGLENSSLHSFRLVQVGHTTVSWSLHTLRRRSGYDRNINVTPEPSVRTRGGHKMRLHGGATV